MRIKYGIAIILYLSAILLANRLVFGRLVGGFLGNYIMPFFAWMIIVLVVYFTFPAIRPTVNKRYCKLFCWAALLCAVIGISLTFAAGVFGGFGRSPYDHSFIGLLINIFYLGPMLLGMELCRAWLINNLFKNRAGLGIAFCALFFTFFTFSLSRLTSFKTVIDGIEFAGNTFIPNLAENILASYLALLGGVIPAIIYQGALLAYNWFSPILPNLNWVIKALVGTFVPAFCLVIVHSFYQKEVLKVKSRGNENPLSWFVVSAISVLTIWFAVGVFNIYPSVILSGSMLPKIEIGDIVIVKAVAPGEIEAGDIIQYLDLDYDVRVNHRVVDIQEDERGLPLFITQGDANNEPDEPVYTEQLMGKVVQVVPKIGWVTIIIRSPEQII